MARVSRFASRSNFEELLRTDLARRAPAAAALDPAQADEDAVHDARVALRRLRTTLRTYRSMFDAGWAAEVSGGLGWWANQLDALRDADVHAARLRASLATLESSRRSQRGRSDQRRRQPPSDLVERGEALLGYAATQRIAALGAVLDAAASARHKEVVAHLEQLREGPRFSARAASPVVDAAPRLLDRPWRDLRSAARRARATRGEPELHVMRIRAKQLRYSAEIVAPTLGVALTRVARAAATVQTALGTHRDAIEQGEWLREHGSNAGAAFLAGQLYVLERRGAEHALADLDDDWRTLRRRWRHWRAESPR